MAERKEKKWKREGYRREGRGSERHGFR